MSFSNLDRHLGLSKIVQRNLCVLLALVLFTTMICSPVNVSAYDPCMTIHGCVRDELGQPAYGMDVYLEFIDPDTGEATRQESDYTDSNGQYSFQPIYFSSDYLIKQFRIVVENPGVPGLRSTWTDNFKYGTYPYDFSIIRYGTTIVHVKEETGAQVPAGVPMWFSYTGPYYNNYDWPWNAPGDGVTPHHTTTDGGNISLRLVASWGYDGIIDDTANSYGGFIYGYAAGQKGYGGIDQSYNMIDKNGVDHTSELRYELPLNNDLRKDAMDVSSQAGKTRELDFYIRALGKVTANARDASTSTPLQDLRWDYYTNSGFSKYRDYSEDGSTFGIYGYGGDKIYMKVSDPSNPISNHLGHVDAYGEATFTPWGFDTVTISMQPNRYGKISGRVIDSSGNGLSEAAVELVLPMAEPSSEKPSYNPFQTIKTTTTDSNGYYTFTNVIPTNEYNEYAIRATKTGVGSALSNIISLGSGEELTMGNLIIRYDSQPPYWESYDRLNVSVGRFSVMLQWRKANDNNGVSGYRIYSGDTMIADGGYEEDYNSMRYTVTGLQPSTNYSFAVKAYDAVGNESAPLSTTVATLQAYDPAAKVIRASVNSEGLEANDESSKPVMSADGRYIAFESRANNLTAVDTNYGSDIFLFDKNTGDINCISQAANGITANASSYKPAISADGRYVAFASDASNLIPSDTNNDTDVYLYDANTQTVELISIGLNGQAANGYCASASISGDGRYIAFASSATNLVANDSNGREDIFVRDRLTGTTAKVSFKPDGSPIAGTATNPKISSNGLVVAYEVYVNYINSIYVYDMVNNTTTLVTKRYNDSYPCRGFDSSISADGRYIAFYSADSSLVPNDYNSQDDIFVYDRIIGSMRLVSLSNDGNQGNNYSIYPIISADGSLVAFKSLSSNLVEGDTVGCTDVFVRNLVEETTVRVSISASGEEGNSDSSWLECPPAISADGRYIAYDSFASNLVNGDNNYESDIFIYNSSNAAVDPPALSEPSISDVTETSATLGYNTSKTGLYYYLVYLATETAPDAAEIKAQGEAAAKGTGIASVGANTINLTGLAPSTDYKAYLIVEAAEENISDVLPISFTTLEDEISPTAEATPKGGLYNSSKAVSLVMTEAGDIYYTIDGTAPTEQSFKYEGPIAIDYTTTLKFMAVDIAGNHSPIYTEEYIIDKVSPTASASPEEGTYFGSQNIVLSMSEAGKLYYTIDGSDPTTNSTLYTLPITISDDTVLKFIAVDMAGNCSNIYTQNYTIEEIPPLNIMNTVPINGANGVPVNSVLRVIFDKEIIAGGGYSNILLQESSGTSVEITTEIDNDMLIIRPIQNMKFDTNYIVEIPASAVMGIDDNLLAEAYHFSFTTFALPPPSPPMLGITGTTPAANSTDVPVNAEITLGFNADIYAVLTAEKLGDKTSSAAKLTLADESGLNVPISYSINGNTILVKPINNLDYETTYRLILPTNVVWDASRNKMASGFELAFTTEQAIPKIVSIAPISVEVEQDISFTLPSKVTALMSDGSKVEVGVDWETQIIDTSKTGIFTYGGNVAGYSDKVILQLNIKPKRLPSYPPPINRGGR